jgi:hypothetical protein
MALERSWKTAETEIEWDTSPTGLCWWCEIYWEMIYVLQKEHELSVDTSKEVGLEINVKKTKYMLLSRHQNAGQKWVWNLVSVIKGGT